jgi:hypothetical protein
MPWKEHVMFDKLRRLGSPVLAVAFFALFSAGPPVRAATIQPILTSVTGAGPFTYTYSLQLTPNNGLTADGGTASTAGGNNESGLVIFDFVGATGATLSAGWAAGDSSGPIVSTGAGNRFPDASFAAGVTNIDGFAGGLHTNDGAAPNVTIRYIGADLPVVSVQTVVGTLTITSTAAPGFGPLQSLDRDTTALVPNEVDTFPVATAAAPLPATANMGIAMLALFGGTIAVRKIRGLFSCNQVCAS